MKLQVVILLGLAACVSGVALSHPAANHVQAAKRQDTPVRFDFLKSLVQKGYMTSLCAFVTEDYLTNLADKSNSHDDQPEERKLKRILEEMVHKTKSKRTENEDEDEDKELKEKVEEIKGSEAEKEKENSENDENVLNGIEEAASENHSSESDSIDGETADDSSKDHFLEELLYYTCIHFYQLVNEVV